MAVRVILGIASRFRVVGAACYLAVSRHSHVIELASPLVAHSIGLASAAPNVTRLSCVSHPSD
jgi:hypothetical protein